MSYSELYDHTDYKFDLIIDDLHNYANYIYDGTPWREKTRLQRAQLTMKFFRFATSYPETYNSLLIARNELERSIKEMNHHILDTYCQK